MSETRKFPDNGAPYTMSDGEYIPATFAEMLAWYDKFVEPHTHVRGDVVPSVQADIIKLIRAESVVLRAELAELHKVFIDARAELSIVGVFSVSKVIDILDTAPEPSDETLKAIEAGDTGP